MKTRILTAVLMMLLASYAYAGGASCATATSLVPDGRALQFDSVQPSPSSNWYQFTATANRSYSVEVRDDVDADNGDLQVTYYGPNSTCSSLVAIPASIATVTDTHAAEPAMTASGKRVSIVTSSTGGGTYWIQVQNTSTTASHYVSAGVTETTIYATEWNSYSPLLTQWYFQNTTSQSIAYTFTVTAIVGGSQTVTMSGTMSPMSTTSANCVPAVSSSACASFSTANGSLNMNASQVGYAVFTHNGPPGSVQSFEFWINYSSTPYALMPMPIGPMHNK
jgi:hypothetical protein